MQTDVYTKEGTKSGQVDLPDDIFQIEPNENSMYRAVTAYLRNRRQGSAKTKTKSEMRGGGRKPWRQKGRGTARAGSVRSPLWAGGGTIFGPVPKDYNYKMPLKEKRLARKSAFSQRMKEENIKIVEDFSFDEIKTRNMVEALQNLELNGDKTLILLPEADEALYLAARNLPKTKVLPANQVSTYDLLNYKKILIFKNAIDKIKDTFNN